MFLNIADVLIDLKDNRFHPINFHGTLLSCFSFVTIMKKAECFLFQTIIMLELFCNGDNEVKDFCDHNLVKKS